MKRAASGLTVAAALLLCAVPALLAAPQRTSAPQYPAALAFFEKQVRPVLAERCYACHGPKLQHGGLRLDRPAFLAWGGEGGPTVKRGNRDGSRLIQPSRIRTG